MTVLKHGIEIYLILILFFSLQIKKSLLTYTTVFLPVCSVVTLSGLVVVVSFVVETGPKEIKKEFL